MATTHLEATFSSIRGANPSPLAAAVLEHAEQLIMQQFEVQLCMPRLLGIPLYTSICTLLTTIRISTEGSITSVPAA